MSEHDESEHEAAVAVSPAADLARVIRARDFPVLHEMLKHWSPPTTASLIEALSVEEQVVAFRLLPRDLAADVFEYLPLEAQERLVKAMATEEVAKILNEMAPDDRTALLDELPAAVTRQLLNLLTPQERSIAVSLLGYPEGSIGRLMTPDYVRVRPEWHVEQALEHIRRYGHDSETLSILYVIDDAGRLIGEVPIRKILLAPATLQLAEGYVQVEARGPVAVKGLADPVQVHALTGASAQWTRLHASAARGLTRFVGRNAEIEQILGALALAQDGHGQIVAIVGEPGVGKSRFVREFTHSERIRDWLILEAGSVAYEKATG